MSINHPVGLIALLVGTTALASPSKTINEMGPSKVGQACPTFGGLTLENQPLSLTRLLAPPTSAVVVSFFASWCKPCQAQLPVIERVLAASKEVRGVLIDYGEEPEVVGSFVTAHKLTLPVIPDKFTKIAGRLGVGETLPRTMVIDGKGKVSAIFEHEGDDFEQALRAAIAKAQGK